MTGEHDHDEYANERDVDDQVGALDAAIEVAYEAIAELVKLCRDMANVISPIQPHTVSKFEERLVKVEALMGLPPQEEKPKVVGLMENLEQSIAAAKARAEYQREHEEEMEADGVDE